MPLLKLEQSPFHAQPHGTSVSSEGWRQLGASLSGFKASGLIVHRQAYRKHQKAYAKSLRDTRAQFCSNIINNSPGNSKQLSSPIDYLLKPQTHSHSEATVERCNNFIIFFRKKIDIIHSLQPLVPSCPNNWPTAWDCPTFLLLF